MSQRCLRTALLFLACIMAGQGQSLGQAQEVIRGQVVASAGNYHLRECPHYAHLRLAQTGGFLVLSVGPSADPNAMKEIAPDVTGMSFLANHILVFTVSPLYGKPGLYLYSFETGKQTLVVGPRTRKPGYLQGADYFELFRVILEPKPMFVFFYSPDADTTDFSALRTGDSHLFRVFEDGTGFGPYRQPHVD